MIGMGNTATNGCSCKSSVRCISACKAIGYLGNDIECSALTNPSRGFDCIVSARECHVTFVEDPIS